MKIMHFMRLVYFSTLAALLFFILVKIMTGSKPADIDLITQKIFIYVKMGLFLFFLVGIPGVFALQKRLFASLTVDASIEARLLLYKRLFVLRIAIFSILGVFSIISFFFSRDSAFLYLLGVAFLMFFISYPSNHKVCSDLDVDESDLLNN